jgi:four helix bundle protein
VKSENAKVRSEKKFCKVLRDRGSYLVNQSLNHIVMLDLKHKKLSVWIKSIELVKEVYLLTNSFPSDERFGLTSQIRRASVSVVSNISEGASRKSINERVRFYEISRSSLVEIDSQIEISILLGYLKRKEVKKLKNLTNEVFAMLSAMI